MKKINKKHFCILLATTVAVGSLALSFFGDVKKTKASNSESTAYERLLKERNAVVEGKSEQSESKKVDENEVIRAIVILKEDSVAEKKSIRNYTKSLKSQEKKILNNQNDVIKKIEKITGNSVENRTAYLINSVSIEAKRKDLKKISQINGVEDVYEANKYTLSMNNAIDLGNVTEQLNSEKYGYTGEGTVVAVIDTGVNYNHQDMVLDEGVKTKYTKEQWQEKIKLLGYGKYMSDKVPFGYDYYLGINDCIPQKEEVLKILFNSYLNHGAHVSGIVSANGKIKGVAKNAQIIGMKVLGINENKAAADEDAIVKAIEDSVKLGADVINMSLGVDSFPTTDNDYMQRAVTEASEEGVLCCVSAGNSSISSSKKISKLTNDFDRKDTSTLGNICIADKAIAVASADNIKDKNSEKQMSYFSSWGPTNELKIKPEISAPGGNINSTFDGENEYKKLSGTSMSSPFVAGSSAIVLNALKAKNIDIKNNEIPTWIKNNLMNTAKIITDNKNSVPYSVRYQGAGMVDVSAAVDNNVIATSNGVAKVELGELNSLSKEFTITLQNYGNTDAKYTLDNPVVYTDYTNDVDKSYYIKQIEGARITFNNSVITVPAKGNVSITCKIQLPSDFEFNKYVESYIMFKGDNIQDLSLPLLGFYGDWSAESIIDNSVYDKEGNVVSKILGINEGTALTVNQYRSYDYAGVEYNTKSLSEENICYSDIVKGNGKNKIDYQVKNLEEGSYIFRITDSLKGKYILKPRGQKDAVIDLREIKGVIVGQTDVDFTLTKGGKVKAQFNFEQKTKKGEKVAKIEIIRINRLVYKQYNGDKVAFSPNGDNKSDCIYPLVAPLRSTNYMDVYVLDSNKKIIRTLAKNTSIEKIIWHENLGSLWGVDYNKFIKANFFKKLGNYSVGWDGKVYDKKKETYVLAKDGQYYIQIASKMDGDSEYQYVTMLVKIDTQKPEIKTLKLRKENNNTFLVFNATDDNNISPYIYIDLEGTDKVRSNQYTTHYKISNATINSDGDYEINLGQIGNDKVNVLFEDVAGNDICIKNIAQNSVSNNNDSNEDNKYSDDLEKPSIELISNKKIKKFFDASETQKYIFMKGFINNKVTLDFKISDLNLKENGINIVVNGDNSSIIDLTHKENDIYRITLKSSETADTFWINALDKNNNLTSIMYTVVKRFGSLYEDLHCSIDTDFSLQKIVFSSNDINKDGTFTIKGSFNKLPKSFSIANESISVNEKDKTFTTNVKLKHGINKIKTHFIDDEDYEEEKLIAIYYDDISVTLDNVKQEYIDSNKVIKTKKATFNIAGNISSYSSINTIDVNGDIVFMNRYYKFANNEQQLLQKFNFDYKLDKGLNTIKIKIRNICGQVVEKQIKVKYEK